MKVWKKTWLVVILVGMAFISTAWSIFPAGTFYSASVLIMITLLAVFIGVRWHLQGVAGIFAWAMGSLAVICLGMVIFFPQAGIMSNQPYTGSWFGIFWHRNYLGTLMALGSMLFLIRVLDAGLSRRARISGLIFFEISLVLVVGSRSVTGIILAVIQTGACLGYYFWLRVQSRMKKWHYWVAALVGLLIVLLAVWKLDAVLSILGRNSSLTGRIPLWYYLIEEFVLKNPWLGFGFGVFWSFEQIRAQTQAVLGWIYPVFIGDNGWVDLALHMGVMGVAFFTLILIRFGILAIKLLKKHPSMLSFLPAGLLLFILLGNLTLSLFLELEFLTWLMLIATQSAIVSSGQRPE